MFHVKHPAVFVSMAGHVSRPPPREQESPAPVGAGLRPRPVGGDGGFVGADPCVGPRADPAKSVSGRTHRSAPTRWGRRSEPTENWCEDGALPSGRDGARPLQETGAKRMRWGASRVWLPPTKFRAKIWGVSHGHRPLRPVGGTRDGTPGRRALRVGAGGFINCRGSALSAERGAGQIRFLPDNLRVQHGVPCPEVCGKPRPCPHRDYLN